MPQLSRRERLRRALELPTPVRDPVPVKGTLIISGPEHDPEAWRSDFRLWMSMNAVHREDADDSGSVRILWTDFCDWAIKHHSVPCTYPTFKRLLTESGFELRNDMCLGLVLREDYESVRNRPARRKGSR